jgi:hypothetical protein
VVFFSSLSAFWNGITSGKTATIVITKVIVEVVGHGSPVAHQITDEFIDLVDGEDKERARDQMIIPEYCPRNKGHCAHGFLLCEQEE